MHQGKVATRLARAPAGTAAGPHSRKRRKPRRSCRKRSGSRTWTPDHPPNDGDVRRCQRATRQSTPNPGRVAVPYRAMPWPTLGPGRGAPRGSDRLGRTLPRRFGSRAGPGPACDIPRTECRTRTRRRPCDCADRSSRSMQIHMTTHPGHHPASGSENLKTHHTSRPCLGGGLRLHCLTPSIIDYWPRGNALRRAWRVAPGPVCRQADTGPDDPSALNHSREVA